MLIFTLARTYICAHVKNYSLLICNSTLTEYSVLYLAAVHRDKTPKVSLWYTKIFFSLWFIRAACASQICVIVTANERGFELTAMHISLEEANGKLRGVSTAATQRPHLMCASCSTVDSV